MLDGVGVRSSRDQVLTELSWLADNGLVVLVDRDGFVLAEATKQGADIATGRASHPKIQRPSPKG